MNDFLSFALKPEVDTCLEQIIVRKWAGQAALCLVKHVHIKKINTVILVGAADNFRKYQKKQKLRFF